MLVAVKGTPDGIVAVSDTVRGDSSRAIALLHDMGLKTAMISRDNKQAAEDIVAQVEIWWPWNQPILF